MVASKSWNHQSPGWGTFEVLFVGLNIRNLKLFDAYRIIGSRILVVTLEYLGDIRDD